MSWCDKCKKVTKTKFVNAEDEPIAERLFFGVLTLGLTEIFADRYHVCEECGQYK